MISDRRNLYQSTQIRNRCVRCDFTIVDSGEETHFWQKLPAQLEEIVVSRSGHDGKRHRSTK